LGSVAAIENDLNAGCMTITEMLYSYGSDLPSVIKDELDVVAKNVQSASSRNGWF
jgi:hypothetical protein